ncbi:MAG: sulfurtransferase TusA family protein [Candidatus Hydrothermarchaeales archaeon]
MDMGLKEKPPSETLDERGKICPYPLMETRDKLKEMAEGELLEVLVDHPPAVENITRLSKKRRVLSMRSRF